MSAYFKNVKEGDEVFGLIFGYGIVTSVWEDSFYTFEVTFKDTGDVVAYTDEGIPAWNQLLQDQTVFYKTDIDITDVDFSPIDKVLSYKKIIKLRNNNQLEIRCPSGIWQDASKCPYWVIEQYIEEKNLHLFRKKK